MTDDILVYFEEIVKNNPYNVALISERQGEMTYYELNQWANVYASVIEKDVDETGEYIGICLDRSFEMIAALLGIIKTGRAYVPLDPSYPEKRIKFYCECANIKTVICSYETKMSCFQHVLQIEDVEKKKSEINGYGFKRIGQCETAYIIFTSGSTGEPKGVPITHLSILNTLKWRINYYGLSHNDTIIQIPSISFSSSVEDIFSTLLSGGKMLIISKTDMLNMKKLNYLIAKYQVTHFLMVPSLYRQLIKCLDRNKLRFVVLAGESVDKTLIRKHYERLYGIKLFVEYGMTETSVGCIAGEMFPDSESNYIGNVISNMNADIINPDEKGVGELIIYGIGVANGYLENSAKDGAERFIVYKNEKAFCTGDYVKASQDNGYVYIGRRDSQVKINGQRINLSEINKILQSISGIENAVTLPFKVQEKFDIVSFIEGNEVEMIDKAWNLLKGELPKQYWPKEIILLNRFPVLPNGKIDSYKLKNDYEKTYGEK